MLFFFFQAEDGIRDLTVTGVQTCALPIYELSISGYSRGIQAYDFLVSLGEWFGQSGSEDEQAGTLMRSEERRVGKGVDLGGRRIIKKKKERGQALPCDYEKKARWTSSVVR